jgi:hypothetical protein
LFWLLFGWHDDYWLLSEAYVLMRPAGSLFYSLGDLGDLELGRNLYLNTFTIAIEIQMIAAVDSDDIYTVVQGSGATFISNYAKQSWS